MNEIVRQLGVRIDAKHAAILKLAIDEGFGDNDTQIMRLALREFGKNHNLEVKEND
jgi:hypothetical protein